MLSTTSHQCVFEHRCQYSTKSPHTRVWVSNQMKSAPKSSSSHRSRNTSRISTDCRSLSSSSSPSSSSSSVSSKRVDGRQEQRRQAFLKKIEQRRDNRRWECRGDQVGVLSNKIISSVAHVAPRKDSPEGLCFTTKEVGRTPNQISSRTSHNL